MTKAPASIPALRYCLAAFAIALALLGGIAAFNAAVDPLAMVAADSGPYNHKPAVYSRMRLYKAYEVARVKPQTLILGSSRTHVGLRCSHEAFAAMEGPCYNLAFDGATAKEMYYYLRHAQAIRPLKHVIVGLDSYHMSPAPATTRPDFDPLLLYSDAPRWTHFITADLRLLTSLDALGASIQTLRAKDHPQPNWFAPDGQRLGDVFFRQVQKTFMEQGPRAYFDEIDRQEVRDQIGVAPVKTSGDIAPAPTADTQESSLSYIRRIIAFCRENNIDLRLFITPSHVHQAEIATMLWGGQAVDSGKRALAELLAGDAARYPDRPAIPVMDFSGYSSITTEPLPPKGSREEMRFYWDSSHFKQIVGDYVLDRMFGIHNPDRTVPADFGVALTADNVEQVLAQQQENKAAFRQRHPEEMASLRALLPGLPILVYHEIRTPERQEPWDNAITISLADFEAQMRYLHKQGYTTLSMQDVMDYLHGKQFPDKIVAIHFDDGWKSAQDAIPVLNRYGFKASFWIIAGAGHDTGSPHMDWDAIEALANNPNFDIESHTMTHPWKKGGTLVDWVKEKPEKARWEIAESKRLLEEKLHRPVPYLAWPSGFYNNALIALAQSAGYQGLLTIDDGFNHPGDEPYHIHRTMVDGRCPAGVFKNILAYGAFIECAPGDAR